jgi:tetratricopeptide (TPR) repeat protein
VTVEVDCPSDETLAAHVAGDVIEPRVDGLRLHLDSCESCRELVVAMVRGTPPDSRSELATTVAAVRQWRREHDIPIALPPRFRIERLLGQGGMGRVYAARDTELDRPVAVKVMRHDLGGVDLAERLVRESRLMARLNHPGVVTIYDIARHDGHVFIAMELIDGITLQAWLRQRLHGWREIVDVFCRAGEGIAAAHAAGLVHRDIKPENILIALSGDRVQRVAVSDFGVARAGVGGDGAAARRSDPNVGLTAAGVAVGTPAYMAPEQLDGGDVDARADVFAFGVSLWEALWNKRPYRGSTIGMLRDAMRAGVPSLPAAGPPRWVGRAVRAAIEPDLARRVPSMSALLAMLDPRARDRRRMFAVVGGSAAVAVAGVAVAVLPTLRAPEKPALCGDAGTTNVWNASARAAVTSALAAMPGEVAAGVRDRALRAGDKYAEQWLAVRGRACALDDVRRRDAAAACLDGRRRALATLVRVIGSLDHTHLAQLDEAMANLPSVELCTTDAAGLAMRGVAPGARERIAALEARLAEVDAMRAAGADDIARTALAALEPEINATKSPVLAAELLADRAASVPDTDVAAEVALYRQAAIAASKAGRDDLAARAWLAITTTYIEALSDATRAGEALALADGAIARGGEDRRLRAEYDLARINLAVLDGAFDDAQHQLDGLRARLLTDAPYLMDRLATANVQLLIEASNLDVAIAAAKALIDERTRRLGSTHELVTSAHMQLSSALLASGDITGALASTKQAVELTRRGYGEDSDTYGLALRNLGTSLDAAGHTDEALTALHQAREILTKTRGPRSFMVGDTYASEATALSAGGRQAESLPLYDEGLAIFHDAVGDKHVRVAETMLSYAATLADLNRGPESIEKARGAVALFRELYGENNPRYGYARSVLGEGLIHAGDKAAARIELEAAIAIFDEHPFDPSIVAGTTFNLAQALTADPTQHDRALALAKKSLAFFETAGPQWKDTVVHIQIWIRHDGH